MYLLTRISLGDNQDEFAFGEIDLAKWYFLSCEQEDNCIRDDGQAQFVESSPP